MYLSSTLICILLSSITEAQVVDYGQSSHPKSDSTMGQKTSSITLPMPLNNEDMPYPNNINDSSLPMASLEDSFLPYGPSMDIFGPSAEIPSKPEDMFNTLPIRIDDMFDKMPYPPMDSDIGTPIASLPDDRASFPTPFLPPSYPDMPFLPPSYPEMPTNKKQGEKGKRWKKFGKGRSKSFDKKGPMVPVHPQNTIIALTNAARINPSGFFDLYKSNLPGSSMACSASPSAPLKVSHKLSQSAMEKGKEMVNVACRDAKTCTPYKCMQYGSCEALDRIRFHVRNSTAECGENVMFGSTANPVEMVMNMLRDKTKCSTMMSGTYSYTGVHVGRMTSGNNATSYSVVQDFTNAAHEKPWMHGKDKGQRHHHFHPNGRKHMGHIDHGESNYVPMISCGGHMNSTATISKKSFILSLNEKYDLSKFKALCVINGKAYEMMNTFATPQGAFLQFNGDYSPVERSCNHYHYVVMDSTTNTVVDRYPLKGLYTFNSDLPSGKRCRKPYLAMTTPMMKKMFKKMPEYGLFPGYNTTIGSGKNGSYPFIFSGAGASNASLGYVPLQNQTDYTVTNASSTSTVISGTTTAEGSVATTATWPTNGYGITENMGSGASTLGLSASAVIAAVFGLLF